VRVAAVSALVIVAVAGASAAAVHLLHRSAGAPTAGRSAGPKSPTSSPAAATTVITPVSASGFDALNSTSNDPGNENSDQAANVLDGNPAGWSTQQYDGSPLFGGLKAGTGFILNLGRPVRVRSVTVTFGAEPGADVEIKLGDSATRSAANLAAMKTVASASNVSGSYTFTTSATATDQYLVVWFTKLPPMAGNPDKYMAQIFSVIVRGTS
jgi:hypothetical protein